MRHSLLERRKNGVRADVVVAEHANAPGAQNTGAAVVVVVVGGGGVVVVVVVAVAVAVNVTVVGARGTAASLPPLTRSLVCACVRTPATSDRRRAPLMSLLVSPTARCKQRRTRSSGGTRARSSAI